MAKLVKQFVRLYGASPLHLLAFIASFALAGYAATELFKQMTVRVAIWFVGAAIGHDIVLVPLYSIANLPLTSVFRRTERVERAQWINYLRFPGAISLILFLIFFPEITRRRTAQLRDSGLGNHPYLSHWLLVTGILFALSAITFAVRLRRTPRATQPA